MSTLDPTLDAEPSAPTLPVVELHPERLRAPGPDDRLDALRAAMLAGGLLSELPAGLGDDKADPPRRDPPAPSALF